jgi:hypothetical protein
MTMHVQVSESFEHAARADRSGERQLWCAVIDRALHDAMDRVAAVSEPTERLKIREDARRWFLRNGNSFRIACEAAGYDPDYLRLRILSLIGAA